MLLLAIFCFLGACPGLCYDKLPEVLQRGQVGVHPAACLAVGKCYQVLKQHHGAGNMLRFPGASSDASLWGPSCSWGSQWREGVAIGSLFLGTLADLWGPVPAWGSQQLGLAFFHHLQESRSEVTQICGDQVAPLTGSGGNWWRRSQSEVAKWVCVLRPTQWLAPYSHCRPPSFPCRC